MWGLHLINPSGEEEGCGRYHALDEMKGDVRTLIHRYAFLPDYQLVVTKPDGEAHFVVSARLDDRYVEYEESEESAIVRIYHDDEAPGLCVRVRRLRDDPLDESRRGVLFLTVYGEYIFVSIGRVSGPVAT